MNDGTSQWTLTGKHVDVSHHIVSGLFLFVFGSFEVDSVDMSCHFRYLTVSYIQSCVLKIAKATCDSTILEDEKSSTTSTLEA